MGLAARFRCKLDIAVVDRMTPLRIASLLLVIGSPAGAFAPRVEPRAVSVHPFVAQPGTMFTAVVRGNSLRGATSIFLQDAPLAIAIEGTEAEPPAESAAAARPRSIASACVSRLRATPGPGGIRFA